MCRGKGKFDLLFSNHNLQKMKNKVLESCAEYKITAKKTGITIPMEPITGSATAAKAARALYGEDVSIYESFFIIVLSRAHKPKGWAKISQGGISGTVVDPAIVAKYTLDLCGQAVILIHNHPSGKMEASEADKNITRKIKDGLKGFFDITVLDHIILSGEDDKYFSFADEGLL